MTDNQTRDYYQEYCPSLKHLWTKYLEHDVFHMNRAETEMMRYMRRLADRDLALDRAMIPLGSCTMKLNSAAEMMPVSWREFSLLHPFAPRDQARDGDRQEARRDGRRVLRDRCARRGEKHERHASRAGAPLREG